MNFMETTFLRLYHYLLELQQKAIFQLRYYQESMLEVGVFLIPRGSVST